MIIDLIMKNRISDYNKNPNSETRFKVANICSVIGIILNFVLFAIKFISGQLSGMVSITSDAFNNLSDIGALIVALLGVKLASKKSDSNHPFGHGRMEYLSGLFVSVLIAIMGFELLKESISKIITPEPFASEYSVLTYSILAISIAIKFYMFFYNKKFGKLINSSPMIASSKDSLSDAVSTSAILITSILASLLKCYVLDGICGCIISCLIMYTGFNTAKETISPLLGKAPDKSFISEIQEIVMSHEKIKGIHDLIVHDYGPGRIISSLHAEVNQNEELIEIHDEIDNIEAEIFDKLNCLAVIHIDPINFDDPHALKLKNDVIEIVKNISPDLSIHDFRIIGGKTHTNLIFDVCMNSSCKLSESEIENRIKSEVLKIHPKHFCVIKVETSFV